MTRKEALQELLAKVEAGVGGRWTFDAMGKDVSGYALDAYHGSLDAAKALHEAVLPGWRFTIWADGAVVYQDDIKGTPVDRKCDPARAWLIAIIKALIAEEHHE